MRLGSLFAGIGGFDLAAESLGWSTAWVSEIDPFASAVLAKHFPHAPNLGDITRIDWSTVERPDILCAGFPCQPHSLAGKRQASADERDLWGECIRCLAEIGGPSVLRPDYFVGENVSGLLTSESGRFFNRVVSDLAALGYAVEWGSLKASECGAPHQRERIFIVAYPTESRRAGRQDTGAGSDDAREGTRRLEPERGGRGLDDAHGGRREQRDASDGPAAIIGAGLALVGNTDSERSKEHGDVGQSGRPDIIDGGPDRMGDTEDIGRSGGIGTPDSWGNGRRCPVSVEGGSRVILPDWSDAIPYRGADGTVRLIPAGAVDNGSRRRLEAGAILDGEASGERQGLDALGRGDGLSPDDSAEAEGSRPEPSLRALADGISDRLAGRDCGGEVEAWATPAAQGAGGTADAFVARKHRAVARGVQMGTALTDTGLQAQEFAGPVEAWHTPHGLNNEQGEQGGEFTKQLYRYGEGSGGSLWPVTESEPGRVAKLRAVGNAVVPAWVVAGPFARILELEAHRD